MPQKTKDGSERERLLESWLADCYRLTGADPDGNDSCHLAEHAVAEVSELRAKYDALSEKHFGLLSSVRAALAKVGV